MAVELIDTTVRVEGVDEDLKFTGLSINQMLADVNSFHFTWRQPEGDASLASQVSFYNDHLSKEVTITIGEDFTFKGIIYAISCNNRDTLGISYEIGGKGLFEKLNQVPECRSFYKQSTSDIFNAVNTASGTTLNFSPDYNAELFYTVQYNQTSFQFLRENARRHGYWMYYSGTEMVMGVPDGEPVELRPGRDVHNINIAAKMVLAPANNTSFNRHSGAALTHQQQKKSASGFIGASQQAGETAYGGAHAKTNISAAATQQLLTDMSELSQKATNANAVILRASSYNCAIKLGGIIKLVNADGSSEGEYIITELHHTIRTSDNYENQFTAVPAEVEVPPYTSPFEVPVCKSQPATVVDNEDADGLDRVKVQFPWQESGETTPWLNVITPHAGKDKGIRFLPEVGDEVLVDFVENNAERPYVLGAFHTEQHTSGIEYGGNNVKIISTGTGKRIVFNDANATLIITDNYEDKYPQNRISLAGSDGEANLLVESKKDSSNASVIQFNDSKSLKIGIMKNGVLVGEVNIESDGPTVTINSKGTINLVATGDLNISAKNINMDASGDIKMKASGDSEIKATNVKVDADMNTDVKGGMKAVVEGGMNAELKGGAVTTISGGVVKIN